VPHRGGRRLALLRPKLPLSQPDHGAHCGHLCPDNRHCHGLRHRHWWEPELEEQCKLWWRFWWL